MQNGERRSQIIIDSIDDTPPDPIEREIHTWGTFLSCHVTRACRFCIYVLLVFLILASFVAMLVMGFVVVLPYSNRSQFQRTICVPLSAQTDMEYYTCSCGKRCSSQFPCTQVYVRLTNESEHGNWTWTAKLSEDETLLGRMCTFYPRCRKSIDENKLLVVEYNDKYGTPGLNLTCLYNTDNRQEVIRTQRFQTTIIIHAMTWPIVVMVISLLSLFIAVWKQGCNLF